MRQNSIDYPGERPARRAEIVEQPGYTGKHYFVVNYVGRQLTVHAADETAAIFWAAKRWGYSFKRPEYHQTARVAKLGYQPDTRTGAMVGARRGSRCAARSSTIIFRTTRSTTCRKHSL